MLTSKTGSKIISDTQCVNFNDVISSNSGKKIYNTNKFLRSLTNVMENDEFAYLFDNYFDTWDNIELFVMFVKVYQSVVKHFKSMDKYEKITLVKLLIDNSKTRRLICNEILDFKKNKIIKKF